MVCMLILLDCFTSLGMNSIVKCFSIRRINTTLISGHKIVSIPPL